MTTPLEKAQCVSWFIETKSDVQTQRNYRSKYGRDPPSLPSIRLWHNSFMETGTVFDTRRSGRPRTSEKNIERIRQAFQRSPVKSIHPYCCQTIGTTTFNSAQSPTQEFKIVCLQSANVTGTSAKHVKTKRICSEHVLRATNGVLNRVMIFLIECLEVY